MMRYFKEMVILGSKVHKWIINTSTIFQEYLDLYRIFQSKKSAPNRNTRNG